MRFLTMSVVALFAIASIADANPGAAIRASFRQQQLLQQYRQRNLNLQFNSYAAPQAFVAPLSYAQPLGINSYYQPQPFLGMNSGCNVPPAALNFNTYNAPLGVMGGCNVPQGLNSGCGFPAALNGGGYNQMSFRIRTR